MKPNIQKLTCRQSAVAIWVMWHKLCQKCKVNFLQSLVRIKIGKVPFKYVTVTLRDTERWIKNFFYDSGMPKIVNVITKNVKTKVYALNAIEMHITFSVNN